MGSKPDPIARNKVSRQGEEGVVEARAEPRLCEGGPAEVVDTWARRLKSEAWGPKESSRYQTRWC